MKNELKLRNMTGIYLVRDDEILLLYRQGSKVVNNLWIASAGGHFEEWELNDPRACVLRELKEELSITKEMLMDLQLRYVALRRTGGEIRQNYYYFARLDDDFRGELSSGEGILKWVRLDEVMKLEMPFTAKYVLEHYLTVGRYDDKLYAGVADEERVNFRELPEF